MRSAGQGDQLKGQVDAEGGRPERVQVRGLRGRGRIRCRRQVLGVVGLHEFGERGQQRTFHRKVSSTLLKSSAYRVSADRVGEAALVLV